jgi:hypothetical protein
MPPPSQIAPAFVEAVLPALRAAAPQLQRSFLAYLPLAKEVDTDFMAAAADQVAGLMSATECVLSASGAWRAPTGVLLPAPQLSRGGAAALISSELLSEALGGAEYPHQDLLASPRVVDVLWRLGTKQLGRQHMTAILTSVAARQWLEGLGAAERAAWLRDLLGCLAAAPALADWPALAAAPLLVLHGNGGGDGRGGDGGGGGCLVSAQELRGRLFVWDASLGVADECAPLFAGEYARTGGAGDKGPLFVAPELLGPGVAELLRAQLGVNPITTDTLAYEMIRRQSSGGGGGDADENDAARLRRVLFVFRNRARVSAAARAHLSQHLQLRAERSGSADGGAALYTMCGHLRLRPQDEETAALMEDLTAAGVAFLHSSYLSASDEPEFNLWLGQLGVRALASDEAAAALLRRWRGGEGLRQHLRHVSYLAGRQMMFSKYTNELPKSHLLLYEACGPAAGSEEGDGAEEEEADDSGGAPSATAARLHSPPSGAAATCAGIKAQLERCCGVRWLRGCYPESSRTLLNAAGVKLCGPEEVGVLGSWRDGCVLSPNRLAAGNPGCCG